jgi:hypothetical protein
LKQEILDEHPVLEKEDIKPVLYASLKLKNTTVILAANTGYF